MRRGRGSKCQRLTSQRTTVVDMSNVATLSTIVNIDTVCDHIDAGEYQLAYDKLLKMKPREMSVQAEAKRLTALCCYNLANNEASAQQRFVRFCEAANYARQAYALTPRDLAVLRVAAMCVGLLAEATAATSFKDRIKLAHEFKKYLDEALDLKPDDYQLRHMRGRFRCHVAGLGWLQRKACRVFFGAPPTATYAEAIEDLQVAYDKFPKAMDNTLWLAKALVGAGKKAEAAVKVREVLAVEARDAVDRDHIDEARELAAKLGIE